MSAAATKLSEPTGIKRDNIIGMTDWRKPYDYPLPDPKANMAEYMLAMKVHTELQNTATYFLQAQPESGYIDPQDYLETMIAYAVSLTTNPYMSYAPANWKPVAAGFKYAASCFDWLKHLPVRQGDENAPSVYTAWLDPSLRMPGAVVPTPTGDGTNPATGQSAAPPGTIL